MCSESTVIATLETKQSQICKSTIYLYPRVGLGNVNVKLTIVPSWIFSDVHPQGDMNYLPRESITWEVAAEPNGTLWRRLTGWMYPIYTGKHSEFSATFSNSATQATFLTPPQYSACSDLVTKYTSPTTNLTENKERLDPLKPSVNPGDSVLLSRSKLPEYLDTALKSLVPNLKARNSFIKLRVSSVSPIPFIFVLWEHKKMTTLDQILATSHAEACSRCIAFRHSGVVGEGSSDAHNPRARYCHACIHVVPWCPSRRPQSLGTGAHARGGT